MIFARVRGLVVTAVIWASLWLGPGLVLGVFRAATLQTDVPITLRLRAEVVGVSCMVWALWGASSGVAFGFGLMMLQAGRAVAELSTTRFLLAGAMGAVAPVATYLTFVWIREHFPVLSGAAAALIFSVAGAIGILSAGVVLWLARRTPSELQAQTA